MKLTARLYLLVLPLLFLLTFCFLSPRETFAAAQQLQPNPFDFNLNNYIDTKIENRQTTKTTNVSIEETGPYQMDVFMAGIVDNIMPLSPRLASVKPRAIPVLAQVIGKMYEYPPASAMAYTQNLLANAGLLAKPAYAQGIGFVGLAPLLPLWEASRNIAYAILIIVMVVIGFMLIFRMKIDPKTVISVQAALPKIILTLILITFSYPIAGFLIDLMYLVIMILIQLLANASKGLTIDLLGTASFITDATKQQTEFITGGWGKLAISVFSFGLIPSFLQQGLTNLPNILISGAGGAGIAAILAHVVEGAFAAWFIPGIFAFGVLILAIIALGLLFTLIRLTLLLINSYIQLILAILFGPILLLKEAIPGQSAFTEWIQNIVANLVVFPATVGIIYLSWIFTAVMWQGNLWGPPLTFVGGSSPGGNPLAIFIGLGIIYMSPNLVASIKKVFHAKPALPITAGSAFAPLTGGAQTAMGAMSQYYYMTQVFGGEKGLGGLLGKFGIGGKKPSSPSSGGPS